MARIENGVDTFDGLLYTGFLAIGKMTTSKRHHFVPAFYLAGFTGGEDRNSPFWCAGKDGRKLFQTNPNNACVENDYYTLTESSDSMTVENEYANLEASIANSLRYIKENNWTPRPDDEAFLHIFAATLYLRVPEFRNSMATPIKRVQDITLDMWSRITLGNARNGDVSEEDFLNATRVHSALLMREHGKAFRNDHDASSGRSEDTITPPVSRDLLIDVELNMLHDTAKLLALRRWFLFSVPECEGCEFITSDNPFVLLPGKTPPKMYGLLTRGTEVVIPLHKRAMLFGTLDEGKVYSSVDPKELVAETNEHIHRGCNRWIYSSRRDVVEQLAANHGRHARSNTEKQRGDHEPSCDRKANR